MSSVANVGQAAWDAMAAGAPLQQSYGYLRTVEVVPGAATEYLVVTDGAGRALAALPTYLPAALDVLPGLAADWPMGHTAPAAQWRDALLAGVGHGYRSTLIVHPALTVAERSAALRLLHRAAHDRRREIGASALLYRHVIDEALPDMRDAAPDLTPVVESAEAYLPVPGPAWSDYLAACPYRRRLNIRREQAAFEASKLTLERGRLGDHWRRLAGLSAQVFQRYGAVGAEGKRLTRYRRMVEHWSPDLTVLLLRDTSGIVGFSSLVPWDGDLYVLDYGLDYDRAGAHAEYFQLVYYEPLRIAAAAGLQRVQLGKSALQAKRLRGAVVTPLWTLFADDTPPTAAEIDLWNAEQWQHLGLGDR
ncbi:GNAT family N-acetyltransferase [Micromonospora sp. NPDC049523]|uniref:GNAT family N-acetyltransferase n=1 Tax=Micromonospora sp. NPDC049523 TaxID=3155921 RepID=UPI0034392909